ncbi:MAG: RNA-binding domain-containing protein [Nitrososphaerales archaeon]
MFVRPDKKSLSEGLDIVAETQIKPSESKEKVVSAISNLFKEKGELRVEDQIVRFVSSDLESLRFLKDQFRDRQVRAAARRLLLVNNQDSNQTFLLLNKQAATVGIAALCDDPRESALGPIILRIRSPKIAQIVDWLTEGHLPRNHL